MTRENSMNPTLEEFDPPSGPRTEESWSSARGDHRNHPRFAYPVRTSVEWPYLPTKAYGICDFSRSGLFLAFTDIRATRSTLERNDVSPGANLVVRFTISLPNETHCCRVQARLVRITRHGIGVRFTPKNPWQLKALSDLLSRAHGDPQSADSESSADQVS